MGGGWWIFAGAERGAGEGIGRGGSARGAERAGAGNPWSLVLGIIRKNVLQL